MSKQCRIKCKSGLKINGMKVHELTIQSDEHDLDLSDESYSLSQLHLEKCIFLIKYLDAIQPKLKGNKFIEVWKTQVEHFSNGSTFIIYILQKNPRSENEAIQPDNCISFVIPDTYKAHGFTVDFVELADSIDIKTKEQSSKMFDAHTFGVSYEEINYKIKNGVYTEKSIGDFNKIMMDVLSYI